MNLLRTKAVLAVFLLVIGAGVPVLSPAYAGSGDSGETGAAEDRNTKEKALKSQEQIRSTLHDLRRNTSELSGEELSTRLQDLFFTFEQSDYHSQLQTESRSLYRQIEKNWTRASNSYGRGDRDAGGRYLERLLHLVEQSRDKLTGETTPTALFVNSLVIILREGVEAILIVAALIGVLMKIGRENEISDIYLGVGTAVVATAALAVAAGTFLDVGGQQQELLEGVTMILAMLVLFSVSHWLIGKISAERWMDYIKDRVESAGSSGNRWALFALSFLVVFREGFETVLFYAGLLAKSDGVSAGYSMVGGGVLLGIVLLMGIYVLVTRYGVQMPMKSFFTVTGILLYLLAFKFAGDGIAELQEAGYVNVTVASWVPDSAVLSTWFGINGTWEGIILQGVLVVAVVGGLVYHFLLLPFLENRIKGDDEDEPSFEVHKQARSTGLKIFTPAVVGLFVAGAVGVIYVGPLPAAGPSKTPSEQLFVPGKYRSKENPLTASSKVLENGKQLYKQHCQDCHGKNGKGNGVVARNLREDPRDFTRVEFMDARSDAYLFYRISEGKPGTAMPAFVSLSPEEKWTLIHYIRSFSDDETTRAGEK